MDRRRADTFDWVAVFELMLLTPVVITRELMLQLRGVVRGVSRQFSIAPLLLQFANRSPADTQRIYLFWWPHKSRQLRLLCWQQAIQGGDEGNRSWVL
jgi:hypothetical protein